MAARMMVPEMKCEFELYEYVLVQTKEVLFCPSTYLECTIFPENELGKYWYVLCLQKYCSGCCLMSYASGKQYNVCVTCMLWCSNTESVPLLVSNIHDIILVHIQYVLVCTSLYYYSFPVPVCTRYVLVRTKSELVRTKYPVPVMQVTILDATGNRPWLVKPLPRHPEVGPVPPPVTPRGWQEKDPRRETGRYADSATNSPVPGGMGRSVGTGS
jgi:hypothetical protein